MLNIGTSNGSYSAQMALFCTQVRFLTLLILATLEHICLPFVYLMTLLADTGM